MQDLFPVFKKDFKKGIHSSPSLTLVSLFLGHLKEELSIFSEYLLGYVVNHPFVVTWENHRN